jgi:D-inositol-3-phosphate glycosyltransferase
MTDNDDQRKRSVALVVPDLSVHSGVPAVALFLHRIIAASGRYIPELISISSSVGDASSTRIASPGSWFKDVGQTTGEWQGLAFRHVGAKLTELEFQRYRPRRVLTEILDQFDIVQVVAGCPPWAMVTKNYSGKVALQVATLSAIERASMLRQMGGFKRLWLWLMTKINTAIERPALDRTDVIFVENRWMYDLLRSRYGDSKVVFAPPGIDTDFFQPDTYKPDGFLLSVGRFGDPRKNVRLLFDVYYRLRQTKDNIPPLVLVGALAPSRDDMKYGEALGILPFVECLENVTLEELRSLYRDASLFLLSSNEEGFGIVIGEAMACGLPVVSTDCGGPSSLIVEGVTGHLTPVGNVDAMTSKTLELIRDANMRVAMGRAARERAVEHFSLEATGRVFLNHYDLLLAGRI